MDESLSSGCRRAPAEPDRFWLECAGKKGISFEPDVQRQTRLVREKEMNIRIARRWGLVSAVIACLIGWSQARADGRVALVIGNSHYQNVPVLANPANDATDVSAALRRLGFNVKTLRDADFESFRGALIEFGHAAQGADMAVLFFAGHGIEIAGDNWLVPIDAALKNDIDVGTEAIGLHAAMLAVSNAKRLGLVILDACRNNPFARQSPKPGATAVADFGLAPVEPAENVLVAYAARDGTTANDGTGRNSAYTAALLRHLEDPGLEIEFLFRDVRDDVMNATNNEQQPFVYGSLSSEQIYLQEPAPVVVAAASTEVVSDAGEIAWTFLHGTFDVGTLRRFVTAFPSSKRLDDAKARITALEKIEQPATANLMLASVNSAQIEQEDIQATRPFRRSTPAVETAWKLIKDSKDVTVVRRFVKRFPSGQRRAALDQKIAEIGGPQPLTREVLMRAATDGDLLACVRVNDPNTPECSRAMQRYPLIWLLADDFRFRFELCRSLGDECHAVGNFLADPFVLQSKALFTTRNPHASMTSEHHQTPKAASTEHKTKTGSPDHRRHFQAHQKSAKSEPHRIKSEHSVKSATMKTATHANVQPVHTQMGGGGHGGRH
jgi:hypothetical protein